MDIYRLTNANVYLNGNNFFGRAEELELPKVAHKYAEHKALGMAGTAEFWAGIDKLEAKIKWSALYPEAYAAMANPTQVVALTVRASLEQYDGTEGRTAQLPVRAELRGAFKEFPMGTFKPKENVEFDSTMSVYYAKLVVDGQELFEIDVLNNLYKVDGADLLDQYRANLGL